MKGFRWGRLWAAGSALFFLLAALSPLPALRVGKGEGAPSPLPAVSVAPAPDKGSGTFRVLRTATGEVETLSREDYLFGVTAAEMGGYPEEALKAQVVAAYSFALDRAA
ncbi:MAG: hypothetical protein J6X61_03690, partial [Clostridia bacterium]|nr:hypothetical protein [Clostridia bacterium]